MPTITTVETDIKERMSLGVVTLIAARAGCEVSEIKVDRTSRDVAIAPIDGAPVTIDAQLKSTSNLIYDNGHVKFDLDIKNYNDLRATNVGTARILIVVDLHNLNTNWLNCGPTNIVFQKCAFWHSLYGEPPTTNTRKKRISIPITQVLTPQSLETIIERRYLRIQGQHGGL